MKCRLLRYTGSNFTPLSQWPSGLSFPPPHTRGSPPPDCTRYLFLSCSSIRTIVFSFLALLSRRSPVPSLFISHNEFAHLSCGPNPSPFPFYYVIPLIWIPPTPMAPQNKLCASLSSSHPPPPPIFVCFSLFSLCAFTFPHSNEFDRVDFLS